MLRPVEPQPRESKTRRSWHSVSYRGLWKWTALVGTAYKKPEIAVPGRVY